MKIISLIFCFKISICLAGTDLLDIGFKYPVSLNYSNGKITFDPTIREVGTPQKFEVIYGFRLDGQVDEGGNSGLHYTFGRGEPELLEIISKIKDLKDGESLHKENLINVKRVGSNVIGLIYRERSGEFTPFEFNSTFESIAKFSDEVKRQAVWIRSRFIDAASRPVQDKSNKSVLPR